MGRTTREMRLRELLGNAGALVEGDDLEVTGIAIDSRRVRAGDVFFALAAQAGEGARHVAEAVAQRVKRDKLGKAIRETAGIMVGSPGWMSPDEVVRWVDFLRSEETD